MPEQQPIQARHGTATFVPKGSVIKIINTHGTQVIDTWAFALPTPPKSLVDKAEKQARALLDKDATSTEKQASKGAEKEDVKNDAPAKDEKNEDRKEEVKEEPKKTETTKKETQTPKKTKGKKDDMGLPSQEEAEQLTSQLPQGGADAADGQAKQQTKGWSSYLPSLRGGKKSIEDVKKSADDGRKETTSAEDGAKEKEQKENTRRWASLIPSGQGFSSYLPSKETISAVVASVSTNTKEPTPASFTSQLPLTELSYSLAGIELGRAPTANCATHSTTATRTNPTPNNSPTSQRPL